MGGVRVELEEMLFKQAAAQPHPIALHCPIYPSPPCAKPHAKINVVLAKHRIGLPVTGPGADDDGRDPRHHRLGVRVT